MCKLLQFYVHLLDKKQILSYIPTYSCLKTSIDRASNIPKFEDFFETLLKAMCPFNESYWENFLFLALVKYSASSLHPSHSQAWLQSLMRHIKMSGNLSFSYTRCRENFKLVVRWHLWMPYYYGLSSSRIVTLAWSKLYCWKIPISSHFEFLTVSFCCTGPKSLNPHA